jgi:outer membrane receptor protein involved in Fe transport
MRSLLLFGASLAAIVAAPLHAQTAAAAEGENSDEYIIVTGSRIAKTNLDSAVPVTTLSVQELTRTGNVSIGDQLSLLPAFRTTFSTQNSGRFIGTAGLNILDLRGLGTARTLVLQNGRRHVTSQPGQQTVDTNTIPVDLIERVDVVTGGNSAIYGSDAVAGVVNFVMKRDFEGIRLRAQSGVTSQGDRPSQFISGTFGKNFNEGRGNVALALEFSNQDALLFSQRDSFSGAFSGRNQFNATQNVLNEPATGDGIPDNSFIRGAKNLGLSTGGAFTSACQGVTDPARRAINCTGLRSNTNQELGRVFVFTPDGQLVADDQGTDMRPFGSGNSIGGRGRGSTLREVGQLAPAVTRYSANLLARYEVSEAFEPFIEAKYVRVDALQEGQPTFNLTPSFRLDNPFLTPQARDLLTRSLAPGTTTFSLGRFNVDLGGRGEEHTREVYRAVVGATGTFNDDWRYEVAFNYGRLDSRYVTAGNVLRAQANNAADAARNAAGQIVCRINVTTVTDPNCVPANFFGEGNISQAARDYFLVDSERKEWSEQLNAIAFMSGDLSQLFELPGGPIGFAVGGEWRQERDFQTFDDVTRSGLTFLNAIGTFEPPTLRVWDVFGEVRVPLLADMRFFEELTVEASGRYSKYNVGDTGGVFAWNLGGVWSPSPDLRIRAGYARAIRAPTQTNLFGALNQTFLNGLVDPCSQTRIRDNPNRVANCAAAGVPTTQTFNGSTEPFTNVPASGVSGFNGSNPNLEEERSTSFTLGAVFQPRFFPGFTFTVDYYDIEIKNAILTLNAQTIIDQCYDAPGGIDNQFCRAITRNPNGTFPGQQDVNHAGTIVNFPRTGSSFTQGPFNFARVKTSGVDFDLAYTLPTTGDFRFRARAIASYLINRDNYTDISRPDFINQQKLELGDPEWSGNLQVGLGYKKFDFDYTLRYVGGTVPSNIPGVEYENMNSVQGRPPLNPDQFPFTFYPDYTYHDIRGTYSLKDATVFFGIDNVLDTMPPFGVMGTEVGAGVYPNTGRYLYVGIDVNF